MKQNRLRLIAALFTSLLLAVGLGATTPASAATNVTVTVNWNGAPLASTGYVTAYTYDTTNRRWFDVDDSSTNGAGQASFSLSDTTSGYRFCAYNNASGLNSSELCYGGDTVEDATSVTGTANIAINLVPSTALNMSSVVIQGKPVVGQTLSVNLSGLPAGLTYTAVTWYRDGALISPTQIGGQQVASGSRYVVRNADAGHSITAYVDAFGPRYGAPQYFPGGSFYLTPAVGPVVLPMGFSSAPGIKAPKWKTGKTARYVGPGVVPPGATATFQWLRNGKAIKGQTGPNHKIVRKDRKKRLSLTVTYTYNGYETTTMTTAPSRKIK